MVAFEDPYLCKIRTCFFFKKIEFSEVLPHPFLKWTIFGTSVFFPPSLLLPVGLKHFQSMCACVSSEGSDCCRVNTA